MGFNWKSAVARFLKAEMTLHGVTRAQMAERLAKMGVAETENSLNNKLSRGTFSAAFFLQCMAALGKETPQLLSVVPDSVRRGEGIEPAVRRGRPVRKPVAATNPSPVPTTSQQEPACSDA